MELLRSSRTEYLLEAPLESLHAESLEWLNELSFWRDEMTFFYHMLRHKQFGKSFPNEELANIEKELVRLNGEELDKVETSVTSHERLLGSVYKTASMAEEQVYREAHKRALGEILALHNAIRKFKKKLFSFIKK
ncbi:MAG TPA: hypothetical protein VGD40_14765 [Chryseosolibacter sp.]